MAIAVDVDLAWATDTDYNGITTTGTFSPGANTLIVAVTANYNNAVPTTVTNSGTALTWTLQERAGADTLPGVRVFTAPNSSAQTNITVTANANAGGYPALKVYVLSGLHSTPISTKGGGVGASGTALTLPPTTWNSSYNDALVLVAVNDNGYNGTMTSSDLTETADTSYLHVMTGYKQVPTAGTSMISSVTRAGTAGTAEWIAIEFRAGAASHDATATRSTTVTTTAAAALSMSSGATRSTTATLTAAAVREAVASASLATTAGITATADVANPNATATLAATATLSAGAALESVASTSVATTATLAAAADVTNPGSASAAPAFTATLNATAAVSRFATATLAATATLTAVGVLPNEATRGLMGGIVRAAPTMTPVTGAGNAPRRVSLLSIDTATMTALVSMTQVPGLAGVPVFIGGDSSPEVAGLVAAGTAYLWISDGVVYYEDGS